jgi:arylsulfatase A-like enzyme
MVRSYLPYLFIIGLLVGCGNRTIAGIDRPPNIILILVDDLGKEWISIYGGEDVSTPNIDQLAKSGMLFNKVYSMPQCTPSRVSLLTGQYPFRHGWVNHWDVPRWGGGAHFDESMNPSLVKELKSAGYRTCIAGKWQIDDFRVEPDALTKNGFDEFCMWTGYEGGIEASSRRYQDPYIFTNAGSKTYAGSFGPDVFRDFIMDFFTRNKEIPFFVYYPMVLTHTPFVDTPDESAADNLGKHKAMVDNGVRDNTIVVLTTDNGTVGNITGSYRGEKISGGKSGTGEAGICAPFIVSWPGHIKSGHQSDALIDFTDILPTFLDIAGVGEKNKWTSANASHIIDGKSFKKVLFVGAERSERAWILGMGGGNNARLTEKGVENQYVFRDRVLSNERYKLYIDHSRKPEKFFDLRNDPFERFNILDSLNTNEQRDNFIALLKVAKSLPEKDSDPKYRPNPSQAWDVEVTGKSHEWKSK